MNNYLLRLLPALLAACALHANEVRLVDQVAVRAPSVTLGEIAIVETHDLTLKEQLRNLDLGKAPALGRGRTITAFKVRSALSKAGLSHITVHGLQTAVRTEEKVISSDELKQTLTDWILANVDPSKEAEVDFRHGIQKWEIPAGDAQIAIESSSKTIAGRTSLLLKAIIDDQVLATRRVHADVSLFQDSVVFVRPLAKGTPVEPFHVETRRTDMTKSTGMEIAQMEEIFGLIPKRNIAIGTAAKATDFEQPDLIERGSLNKIVVVNGSLRMKISGAEALQSGKKGEIVLFSNPINSREPLRARVVRPGVAVMNIQ